MEMYARGLLTRDVEALFADETGKPLLSRTAVSTISERLWAEYEALASRDLAELDVVYLFVDRISERLHLGQPREAFAERTAPVVNANVTASPNSPNSFIQQEPDLTFSPARFAI